MTRILYVATFLAAPLLAQVDSPECDRCWHGLCEVVSISNPSDLKRVPWSAACRIETLSGEGFVARWRILMIPFDKDPESVWLPEIADFVTTQAVDDFDLVGALWYEIPLWGRIHFVSLDPETREDLRELSDIPDTRPNNITIRPLQNSAGQPVRRVIELLSEEPEGLLENGFIDWGWLLRHWESHKLLDGME